VLKSRLIFTLLYDNSLFALSRNFRLQKVGNLDWLNKNYNFRQIAHFIDEIIVLDVSREERNTGAFCMMLHELTKGCFSPVSAGGGVRSMSHADALFKAGADKVVVNTALFDSPDLILRLSERYGQQSLVGSIDYKRDLEGSYQIFVENGSRRLRGSIRAELVGSSVANVGELYINSIDRDGTGQGYDFGILNEIPEELKVPLIMAGGAGNSLHLQEGLSYPGIDAVATANLLNFVGDGLERSRRDLIKSGVDLVDWSAPENILTLGS